MRIQVLPLPSVVNGDDVEEPFALVLDQASATTDAALWEEFATRCGARGVMVTPETVQVVDRYLDSTDGSDMVSGLHVHVGKDPAAVAEHLRFLARQSKPDQLVSE